MQPFDFKIRFKAALPAIPPGLNLRLDEFVTFDKGTLSGLSKEDVEFLTNQGLPRAAPPFLNFAAYSPSELLERLQTFEAPPNLFPIGHNGSGDILAVIKNSGAVVYFNHDTNNTQVFINSTLRQFAECLCVFQEHLRAKAMHLCLAEIDRIDSASAKPGAMWHHEVIAEVGSLT